MRLTSQKVLVFLVFVFFVLIRIPGLTQSFWLDEAAQILESTRLLKEQLHISYDFHPPLFHIIIHILALFNTDEWWLRLGGSLLPSSIATITTYFIAKKHYSDKNALFTIIILSTSYFVIFYSQELRPYSLPAMFATLSWYFFLSENNEHNIKKLISIAIFNSLGLWTSYLYIFLVMGQTTYLIHSIHYSYCKKKVEEKKQLLYLISSILLIPLISFIPWIPSLIEQLKVGEFLQSSILNWSDIVGYRPFRSLALIWIKFFLGNTDFQIISFHSLALFIISIIVLMNSIELFFHNKNIEKEKKCLLIHWGLIPIILTWLTSWFIPILQPKRILFVFYPFAIFIAEIFINNSNQNKDSDFIRKLVRFIVLFLFIVLNLTSVISSFYQPELQRENWKSLQSYISQKYKRADTVLIHIFYNQFAPWYWYNKEFKVLTLNGDFQVNEHNIKKITEEAIHYNNIIIFDYMSDLTDPHKYLFKAINDLNWQNSEIIDYPHIGFVRVYTKKQ